MKPFLTTLPPGILEKIPQYTFTYLFNKSAFIFKEKKYVLERSPPISVTEQKYSKLIINPKLFGVKKIPVISSTIHNITKNNYNTLQIITNMAIENMIINESISYPVDKQCKHCIPCKYAVNLKSLDTDETFKWDNEPYNDYYCCQTLLISYDVPKIIKNKWVQYRDNYDKYCSY